MAYFYRCARCGAALDAGERCGCEEAGNSVIPHPSPAGTSVPAHESGVRFVPMSQGSRDKVALLRARLGKRTADAESVPAMAGASHRPTVRSDASEGLPVGFYDFFRV